MESGLTLGKQMSSWRHELGVSASAAARSAGVHRLTWRAWEHDEAVPETYNHVRIERTLRWRAGSVAAALAGKPVVLDTGPELRDEAERQIWAVKAVPQDEKLMYIDMHRARLEQAARRSRATPPGEDLSREGC